MVFETAQWIWVRQSVHEENEYAEMVGAFSLLPYKKVILRICAKSDYHAFVNGREVGFNQYADFPDKKVYDEYDISDLAHAGENVFAVRALSKNYDTSSHIKNGKGILFEIVCDGVESLVSDERILARLSRCYVSGKQPYITSQLGMGYTYDFRNEDDWLFARADGFSPAAVCDEKTTFAPRPVSRLQWGQTVPFVTRDGVNYDGGKELVGYLYLDIESDGEKELTLSFGEHLYDGTVRRKIHDRDFSLRFILKKGRNVFADRFLRLGLRYISFDRTDITVRAVGIAEAYYPVTVRKKDTGGVPQDMYDAAVYTLRCCMHDHYEDCPWREQAQYTMDSRTQMLCGYYAFGETAMPAAALRTMAHRLTAQNVFPITSPSSTELSIPTFSLVYPLMLEEYYEHTGDTSVLVDVFENTRTVTEHYISRMVNGLIPMLDEWNFFEWEEGLHNDDEIAARKYNGEKFSLPVNAFFIVGLKSFAAVCRILGRDGTKYARLATAVQARAHDAFLGEDGYFCTYNERGKRFHRSEYGQVFALYSDIARNSEREKLLRAITSENDLVPLTVSSYLFKYEVLLREGGYEKYILRDLDKVWGYMLREGATTFWETIKGAADFDGAGSLCHGWSAVPIFVAARITEGGKKSEKEDNACMLSALRGGNGSNVAAV